MRINKELEAELNKKGFFRQDINGVIGFLNKEIKWGFEIKNNHINPFHILPDLEREYIPEMHNCHQKVQDCDIIIENMQEVKKKPDTIIKDGQVIQGKADTSNNEGSLIMPLYITAELMEAHPGTIKALLSLQVAPLQYIKKDGNKAYVEGHYVTTCLNYAFKFLWSSKHVETREDDTEFSVVMHFAAKMDNDKWIKKSICGQADKKFSKTIVDENGNRAVIMIGDTIKAAITDAKKKFASELGMFKNVYAGEV